jgi:hypothetical protein
MLSPRLTWGLTDPLADPMDLEIGWAIDLKEEVNASKEFDAVLGRSLHIPSTGVLSHGDPRFRRTSTTP